MSPELADDDPRKWTYTDHARAKHAIQWTYLGAWLAILGSRHPELLLFDGFAGRGRYEGGEEGSPLLFWRRAVKAVQASRPKRVAIHCIELNKRNFADLSQEIAQLNHPGVAIDAECSTFEEAAGRKADQLLKQSSGAPPTFWTADPYGFKGVPLTLIRQLMSIPRSEVLITFMVRDMRRFLGQENFEAPLQEFFGGDGWKACLNKADAESREQCLLLKYREIVRRDVARFATPFRVFEDERSQTLYYLVHLSDHPLGMRKMREAMIRESPDMTFWPITIRPKDQLTLDVGEQSPYPRLQAYLTETYASEALTFEDLLNRDYASDTTGCWVEAEYRDAILDMERHNHVEVVRKRTTPTGLPPRGLKLEDEVRFHARLLV